MGPINSNGVPRIWFRQYVSILDPDDKTQDLSDKLFRQWMYLQAAYRKSGGVMPEGKSLARCLRVPEARTGIVLARLHEASLIDPIGDTWAPHEWDAQQYESDSSTERVRAFRERRKRQLGNVTGNVSLPFRETLQETLCETARNVTGNVSETVSDARVPDRVQRTENREQSTHTPDACVPAALEEIDAAAFERITGQIWTEHPADRRGTLQECRQYASQALTTAVNGSRSIEAAGNNHRLWLNVYAVQGYSHSLKNWWTDGHWMSNPGDPKRKQATSEDPMAGVRALRAARKAAQG